MLKIFGRTLFETQPKVEVETKPKRTRGPVKNRKYWTHQALAAQSLLDTGEVSNFSAIYAGFSNGSKRTHGIRLASTIHELRHKLDWDIKTEINEHGTAVYKLIEAGQFPVVPKNDV